MNILDLFGGGSPSYAGLLSDEDLLKLRRGAQTQGILSLANALLEAGAPSKTPQSTSLGLLKGVTSGMQGYQQAMSGGLQDALTIQKLQEAKAAKARQEQVNQLLPQLIGQQPIGTQEVSMGGMPAIPGTPTQVSPDMSMREGMEPQSAMGALQKFYTPAAQVSQPVMGQVPVDEALQKILRIGGPEALSGATQYAALKDIASPTPDLMAVGNVAIDKKTGKVVYQAPEKIDTTTTYKDWVLAGKPGTYADFLAKEQASKSQNINVSLTGDKAVAAGLGGGISDTLKTSHSQALGAVDTIRTIETIKPLLSDVYSGPFSSAQTLIARVGAKMGTTGKTTQETLQNTTKAVQGLAQLELDTAQQMKGQGQITEAERALIKRAAGGDLATMTASEVQGLISALDKTSKYKIRKHEENVRRVEKMPGGKEFAPFYRVDMPTFSQGNW